MMRVAQNHFFFSGYIIILAQRINIYYMTNKLKKNLWVLLGGILLCRMIFLIYRHWPSGSVAEYSCDKVEVIRICTKVRTDGGLTDVC
jgi:hypothetical protein